MSSKDTLQSTNSISNSIFRETGLNSEPRVLTIDEINRMITQPSSLEDLLLSSKPSEESKIKDFTDIRNSMDLATYVAIQKFDPIIQFSEDTTEEQRRFYERYSFLFRGSEQGIREYRSVSVTSDIEYQRFMRGEINMMPLLTSGSGYSDWRLYRHHDGRKWFVSFSRCFDDRTENKRCFSFKEHTNESIRFCLEQEYVEGTVDDVIIEEIKVVTAQEIQNVIDHFGGNLNV